MDRREGRHLTGTARGTVIGYVAPWSAFDYTTGIRRADTLAVPFLATGAVGAVGLIIALSILIGGRLEPVLDPRALTVANTPGAQRERVQELMRWC